MADPRRSRQQGDSARRAVTAIDPEGEVHDLNTLTIDFDIEHRNTKSRQPSLKGIDNEQDAIGPITSVQQRTRV